jgi:hypothetical protein
MLTTLSEHVRERQTLEGRVTRRGLFRAAIMAS